MDGLAMLELLKEIDPGFTVDDATDLIRLATKRIRAQKQQIEALRKHAEALEGTCADQAEMLEAIHNEEV